MEAEVATGREEGAGKAPARGGACDGDNGGLALPAPAPSASGLDIVRIECRQQGEDMMTNGRMDRGAGPMSGKARKHRRILRKGQSILLGIDERPARRS